MKWEIDLIEIDLISFDFINLYIKSLNSKIKIIKNTKKINDIFVIFK
jgi:hypothetical protein